MGKSSLCRQIAQSWTEGNSTLRQRFHYVFTIPMRSVRSVSLEDIICIDVQLVSKACKARLEQELDNAKVLFVLDSYGELSREVKDTEEINRLIRREI